MKTVALILAGGKGTRMGSDVPKQFLDLGGKPIVVHAIECFQRNSRIDGVAVVCNPAWVDRMEELVGEFGLDKVLRVVPGGATSHDSTTNGILSLRDVLGDDDFVVVHDAVRPILPQRAIDEMLDVALEKGNASLAVPCYETVILTDDGESGETQMDRSRIMRIQTPQAYRYGEILGLYERARTEGRHDFVYADLVYIHYGRRVYFSRGFMNNIKITKPEDLALCASLMRFDEDQLFNLRREST